ncbi:MAG: uncharacterized protein KVP18_001759 [Porospora cf. gigantea A]|uniref:uncharacterized protein n=1 Tax=Porospora cf. gigantea A TaxID=2853593 RepID=UPI00355A2EAC|nr:MAG: hypothetical protein KVP18_001759 [Porospora cf. gigantea A]
MDFLKHLPFKKLRPEKAEEDADAVAEQAAQQATGGEAPDEMDALADIDSDDSSEKDAGITALQDIPIVPREEFLRYLAQKNGLKAHSVGTKPAEMQQRYWQVKIWNLRLKLFGDVPSEEGMYVIMDLGGATSQFRVQEGPASQICRLGSIRHRIQTEVVFGDYGSSWIPFTKTSIEYTVASYNELSEESINISSWVYNVWESNALICVGEIRVNEWAPAVSHTVSLATMPTVWPPSSPRLRRAVFIER